MEYETPYSKEIWENATEEMKVAWRSQGYVEPASASDFGPHVKAPSKAAGFNRHTQAREFIIALNAAKSEGLGDLEELIAAEYVKKKDYDPSTLVAKSDYDIKVGELEARLLTLEEA